MLSLPFSPDFSCPLVQLETVSICCDMYRKLYSDYNFEVNLPKFHWQIMCQWIVYQLRITLHTLEQYFIDGWGDWGHTRALPQMRSSEHSWIIAGYWFDRGQVGHTKIEGGCREGKVWAFKQYKHRHQSSLHHSRFKRGQASQHECFSCQVSHSILKMQGTYSHFFHH